MTQYMYSAWDGCQRSNVPSADDLLNALTDDLLRYGDLSWALEELLRRGYTSPDGKGRSATDARFIRHPSAWVGM